MDRLILILFALRNRHFAFVDLLVFSITPSLALMLRTDGLDNFRSYSSSLLIITLGFMVVKFVVFYIGGLYSHFWRYAGHDELGLIVALAFLSLILQTVLFFLVLQPFGWIPQSFPRSIPIIEGLLAFVAVAGVRYIGPISERLHQRRSSSSNGTGERVVVAGARGAGVAIIEEMQRYPALGMKPVAFVDNDMEKQGTTIRRVPVLGKISDLARVCRETDATKVIIAMPKARGKVIRDIVSICEEAGLQVKTVPGTFELLGGSVSVKKLRDVVIEDLLRREPIQTDLSAVSALVSGKRVLITGGGGSIGSELCRQVLRFEPKSLVILGHGENSVFEIHNELKILLDHGLSTVATEDPSTPRTQIHSVIADIRSVDRLYALFEEHRPEVVFHAAAHKHVPLMEMNPAEAITNNVIGTRNVIEVSQTFDVGHFVMISTDKAVNPSSVMGASKRVAELLVHKAAKDTGKPYVAVRFGNVLGSRGSVVLTFRHQIAAGGPVTVTHPEMTRYFMTIPEAVQLVLQAAAMGSGDEVFMLDMGEQVRISDLAKDLIELSGLQVGHDIDIVYTGLRPGEKLYEEMFLSREQFERTPHTKIFIANDAASFVPHWLGKAIDELDELAQRNYNPGILRGLKDLVPEYRPANQVIELDPQHSGPLQTIPHLTHMASSNSI